MPTDTSLCFDFFSWLPSWFRFILQIRHNILLVIIEICVIIKLFFIAQCSKDTTRIMVAQRFEVITKACQTSCEKPQEMTEGICPCRDAMIKPSFVLAPMWLKCGLRLLRKACSFLWGNDIQGMSFPSKEG